MDLSIVSYNCNSIRKKIDIICELMASHDIVLLQEILLTVDNINYCDNIHADFDNIVMPSKLEDGDAGRPKGGLAIFFKKCLSHLIKPISLTEQFLGIIIKNESFEYFIINAYLPCDTKSADALADYQNALAELHFIINRENINKVIIAGDLNADPFKGRFYSHLRQLVEDLNFSIADLILPINSYSYISTHDTTSWIDHVITSQADIVNNISIKYGVTISDHIPIAFNLEFNLNRGNVKTIGSDDITLIDWKKLTRNDEKTYSEKVDNSLNNYFNLALQCRDNYCSLQDHKNLLNDAYEHLLASLANASQQFNIINNSKQFKAVPGWNINCKLLYSIARDKYKNWNNNGRIRFGQLYNEMKASRAEFKRALKICRIDENNVKKFKLCNSFMNKDKKNFWKDIKNLKNNKTKKATSIDNENDPRKITEIFSEKYRHILDDPNSYTNSEGCNKVMQEIEQCCQTATNMIRFSPKQVASAINKINVSRGFDRIDSSHFKIANKHSGSISDFLSRMFTAFICHGHIPQNMARGEIKPVVKNKFGNINSSDNYRPVMNSPNILKIFEYCLQPKINFTSNSRQFGFKKGSSTLIAVTSLKETIKKYLKGQSRIYSSFVDISKAFDKVNLNVLICKLKEKNISPLIINTLNTLYRHQNVHVNYDNSKSTPWLIRNGIRQGGILSPTLFCLYIDDVLSKISDLDIGCKVINYRFNIIAYADDIVLIGPSSLGLQKLLNKLGELLSELCLKVNTEKTVCMLFRTGSRQIETPIIKLYGNTLKFVKEVKYLGVIMMDTLCNSKDIVRSNAAFLRQFWCFYRNFSYSNLDVLTFLFNYHCTDFYGSVTWSNSNKCKGKLRSLGVAYHKALKIMLNVPWYESNRVVCEALNLHTFEHHINRKLISFAFQIYHNFSECITPIKYFLLHESEHIDHVIETFHYRYGIADIFNNDLKCIYNRINYIQRYENS